MLCCVAQLVCRQGRLLNCASECKFHYWFGGFCLFLGFLFVCFLGFFYYLKEQVWKPETEITDRGICIVLCVVQGAGVEF